MVYQDVKGRESQRTEGGVQAQVLPRPVLVPVLRVCEKQPWPLSSQHLKGESLECTADIVGEAEVIGNLSGTSWL